MKRFLVAAALACALLPSLEAAASAQQCVDPEEKARLLEARRTRREATDRDFIKAGRHEISLFGGYYVSDLFDGTFLVGGSYTYHLTEDFGVEAAFGYAKIRSSVAAKVEADRGVTVLPPDDRQIELFANLVWAPLHGKGQLFADTILHFDLYIDGGVGVIDSATSTGAAGEGGVGMKVFLGRATAIRLDLRDRIYQQQILAQKPIVQDFSFTLGLSLFLPPTP